LGPSIADALVKAHGDRREIASLLAEDSMFNVFLPLALGNNGRRLLPRH
jgi:hypothetical protein